MKKTALLLACLLCLSQLSAQIRYQKFYDSQNQQVAVEGTMTDDSVRTAYAL